jgi:hypothetical protein
MDIGSPTRKSLIDGLAFPLPLEGGGAGRGSRAVFAVLVESQRTPTPTLPLKKGEGAQRITLQ